MPRILNAIIYPPLIRGSYPLPLTLILVGTCLLAGPSTAGPSPKWLAGLASHLGLGPGYNINGRLKGAVDRELGGNIVRLFEKQNLFFLF